MSRSKRFIEYGEAYDESIEKYNKRFHNLKSQQKRRGHKKLKHSRRSWRKFKNDNDNGSVVIMGIRGMAVLIE